MSSKSDSMVTLSSRLDPYIAKKLKNVVYGYTRRIQKVYGCKCAHELQKFIIAYIYYSAAFPVIEERLMYVTSTTKQKSKVLEDTMHILANQTGNWSSEIMNHLGVMIIIFVNNECKDIYYGHTYVYRK